MRPRFTLSSERVWEWSQNPCKLQGKYPLYWKILPRGGSNPRHCIKQYSEPNTLPTSYSGPPISPFPSGYRLVGLVVRRPLREQKIPGSNPACARIFSGSSHTSDLTIGTPVATLPGAWRYRISAGTGRPGVSILWLGEVESWICNFYLSVAARQIVWADPSLRYTCMLRGR